MTKRDDSKPVKEIIEIFIDNQLKYIGSDSGPIKLDITPYIQGVAYDGSIYKIMDEVCDQLVGAGWHCYYKHYYTFIQFCYLTISPNTIKDRPKSEFIHFVPFDREHTRHGQIFQPK